MKNKIMKNKHHEITINEFQDWRYKEEVVFAFSSREAKRLVCTLSGNIKVTVGGKTVWEGVQPYLAVEAYNAIAEEYTEPKPSFKL